jgi:hypothetical protein
LFLRLAFPEVVALGYNIAPHGGVVGVWPTSISQCHPSRSFGEGNVEKYRNVPMGGKFAAVQEDSVHDSLASSSIAHEIDIRSLVPNEIAHVSSRASLHPGMFNSSALAHRDHRTLLDGCVPDLVEYRPNSPALMPAPRMQPVPAPPNPRLSSSLRMQPRCSWQSRCSTIQYPFRRSILPICAI